MTVSAVNGKSPSFYVSQLVECSKDLFAVAKARKNGFDQISYKTKVRDQDGDLRDKVVKVDTFSAFKNIVWRVNTIRAAIPQFSQTERAAFSTVLDPVDDLIAKINYPFEFYSADLAKYKEVLQGIKDKKQPAANSRRQREEIKTRLEDIKYVLSKMTLEDHQKDSKVSLLKKIDDLMDEWVVDDCYQDIILCTTDLTNERGSNKNPEEIRKNVSEILREVDQIKMKIQSRTIPDDLRQDFNSKFARIGQIVENIDAEKIPTTQDAIVRGVHRGIDKELATLRDLDTQLADPYLKSGDRPRFNDLVDQVTQLNSRLDKIAPTLARKGIASTAPEYTKIVEAINLRDPIVLGIQKKINAQVGRVKTWLHNGVEVVKQARRDGVRTTCSKANTAAQAQFAAAQTKLAPHLAAAQTKLAPRLAAAKTKLAPLQAKLAPYTAKVAPYVPEALTVKNTAMVAIGMFVKSFFF